MSVFSKMCAPIVAFSAVIAQGTDGYMMESKPSQPHSVVSFNKTQQAVRSVLEKVVDETKLDSNTKIKRVDKMELKMRLKNMIEAKFQNLKPSESDYEEVSTIVLDEFAKMVTSYEDQKKEEMLEFFEKTKKALQMKQELLRNGVPWNELTKQQKHLLSNTNIEDEDSWEGAKKKYRDDIIEKIKTLLNTFNKGVSRIVHTGFTVLNSDDGVFEDECLFAEKHRLQMGCHYDVYCCVAPWANEHSSHDLWKALQSLTLQEFLKKERTDEAIDGEIKKLAGTDTNFADKLRNIADRFQKNPKDFLD